MQINFRSIGCLIVAFLFSAVVPTAKATDIELQPVVSDLAGNPISTITTNSDFLLTVYVEDVRTNPTGVFSAFTDVEFDATMNLEIGTIRHSSTYPNGTSGSIQPGLIDEAGGVAGIDQLFGGRQTLFEIPMTSRETGTLTFATGAPTDLVNHPILLYGIDTAIPLSDVDFGSITLTIVPEPSSILLIACGLMVICLRARRRS